jgi:carboxypeptidase C (cathepsin A)
MRFTALFVTALALFSAAFVPAALARDDYTARALQDEISHLPAVQYVVPFRQFSGYIPVAGGKREIFYWFFEAYGDDVDATTAPITWWTSGGPGCGGTGLGGLGENGPFAFQDYDGALKLRTWSWTKFTSMLYVDQPAGVGFSIAKERPDIYTDALSAQENYEFLKGWFERFPNYKPNKFFLSSESYGGHYVPQLALEIAKRDSGEINFAGFVVGNPLTYMPYRDYGQAATYATHQLVPDPLWRQYAAKCTPDPAAPTPNPPAPRDIACDRLETEILSFGSGLDPYALDFPICSASSLGFNASSSRLGAKSRDRDEKTHFLSNLRRAHSLFKTSVPLGGYFPENYEPCVGRHTHSYLNYYNVREALHVPKDAPEWSSCADINYSASDMIDSMIPVYKELKKLYANELKMLIYAGDNDSICATVGEQQWIWNQGFEVLKKWAPWKVNQQVAGFHVKFRGLDFITIHGAGHMAPVTRPEHTFEAIRAFMNGKL